MTNNKLKVLIIDDDADIRELLKIVLEADGYHVNIAVDGADALTQLGAGLWPALILLDLMMPRLDGEQFMKKMRGTRYAKIPVVLLSGHSAAAKKADDLHAASCLNKPVEVEELLDTVRRFAHYEVTDEVA
jgi:CheY-like chemotaxis protein